MYKYCTVINMENAVMPTLAALARLIRDLMRRPAPGPILQPVPLPKPRRLRR